MGCIFWIEAGAGGTTIRSGEAVCRQPKARLELEHESMSEDEDRERVAVLEHGSFCY